MSDPIFQSTDTKTDNPMKSETSPENAVIDVNSLNIHTMPKKFLGVKPGKKTKQSFLSWKKTSQKKPSHPTSGDSGKPEKKKTDKGERSGNVKRQIIIAVSVIAVLGIIMGVGAFLYVRSLESNQENLAEVLEVDVEDNIPNADFTKKDTSPPDIPDIVEEVPSTEVSTTTDTDISDVSDMPVERPGSPTAITPFIDPEFLDVDKDLLTVEEERIFGTLDSNPDNDGDGFTDGQEVLNMFDPRFGDGALLADSSSVRTYVSPKFGYRVLVPTVWNEDTLSSPSVVRFVSDSEVSQGGTGEFIDIAVEENKSGYATVEEWYASEFPGVDLNTVTVVPGQDITGILSPDKLTVFFLTDKYVYTISYTPSVDTNIYFETVFNMVARSFTLFSNPLDG